MGRSHGRLHGRAGGALRLGPRVHSHRDAWCTTTSSTSHNCGAGAKPCTRAGGNHVTVLFGDFLYLKSMSLALTQDDLAIIRLLCDVTLRIVEGEIYQLTKNGDGDLTEAEHFDIVQSKTAYLLPDAPASAAC